MYHEFGKLRVENFISFYISNYFFKFNEELNI